MSHDPLLGLLGILGAVVLAAALLSGLSDRTRLPQVLILLALGTALGPYGLGLISFGIDSPALRVIATLALLLVLFTDAVDVAVSDLQHHLPLALRILGPATLLTGAAIAFAAWRLLGLGAAESALLGAALASTDPVLLRGVLRDPALPGPARYALRLESGMNDAVLLPVVLVAIALLDPGREAPGIGAMARGAGGLFLIGIGAGIVIGLAAVTALTSVRARTGMRRDYESLYGFGVALAAFAAAETIGGSGFLAAFAAGLTIAALDVELCECFFDFGQATAELVLLFTFVALGSSAIWRGLEAASGASLLFAGVALLARTPILWLVLAGSSLDRRSRLLTAWHGPRGLSSLLLVLLAVFAGLPRADELFALTALVVLLSTALHGGSQALLGRRFGAATTPAGAHRAPPPAAPLAADAGAAGRGATTAGPTPFVAADPERLELAEVAELERRGLPVQLLDVRSAGAYREASSRAPGARRVPPERTLAVVSSWGLPLDSWLVSYCT